MHNIKVELYNIITDNTFNDKKEENKYSDIRSNLHTYSRSQVYIGV